VRFGALDSAPVRLGGTVAEALAAALTRARDLDALGCHRLWFTEHHLAPDVASSAPLTLAGQAASRSARMRVGAGGGDDPQPRAAGRGRAGRHAVAALPRPGRPGPARCRRRDRPHVVVCLPVVVAGSDDEARWWFRSVQQRYLDRLRTGGAPLRPPEQADLDWSTSERYRVDAMLEAAVVGSAGTAAARLRDVARRWAPDEVMAMTDLPDPAATMRSFAHLAELTAGVPVP
jgi:alkanesulfonate monooxygenase SsuD/methylene tetrahydromethanopterin reductase-like flavin-dependent oxidoreductase (luciferase family)